MNLKLREDTALAIRQALSQLRQQIEQTRSQKLQLKAQISRNGFALREAQASRKVADAQFVEKRLNTASAQFGRINAPKTGSITSLQAKAGDVVASGQLLGFLIAQQNKQPQLINLWVPSRAIGLVRVDKVVRLLFDSYPYQTYGVGLGHVVEVAGVPMMPSELPTPIETREQMYKVVVELDPLARTVDGEPWRLTPGMRVTADLVLDEKSLLAWLLDPLIAANRRAAS